MASSQGGCISFNTEENLQRCLLTGTALNGQQTHFAFHNMAHTSRSYVGLGSSPTDTYFNNFPSSAYGNSSFGNSCSILPVGKNAANPAFTTDYIPICTDLEWCPWTPTRLASDFGVYMHYADNTTGYGNRFIVSSGINEWEVIGVANNAYVNTGASATFLARVI
jgi:hypothetical protein